MEGIRIDKWLWAVRIFKTRTEATEACKRNRVLLNGNEVKPSKETKPGDIITVKRNPVNFTFKVLDLIQNRQPAKNVCLYAENITSAEEIEAGRTQRSTVFVRRDKGAGRPTKKERRDIDDFGENLFSNDWDDGDIL